MADVWQAILDFFNAIIKDISIYVHSPEALIIDTRLAALVKYCSDAAVELTKEFLDIFGR